MEGVEGVGCRVLGVSLLAWWCRYVGLVYLVDGVDVDARVAVTATSRRRRRSRALLVVARRRWLVALLGMSVLFVPGM